MLFIFCIILAQTFFMIWLYLRGFKMKCRQGLKASKRIKMSKVDVVITSNDDFSLIEKAVTSIEDISINAIILALDHPDEKLIKQVENLKIKIPIKVISNFAEPGKIHTQKLGLLNSSSETVLLMDADIRLDLTRHEFKAMCQCFADEECDFLCPYSHGIFLRRNVWGRISDCDRVMRQQIVRAGRDYYGVSNLSGYFMLADRKKYLEVVDSSCIQDDVMATINLFRNNYRVRTYHHVVCGELERDSFYGLFMQQVRWSIGNLLVSRHYLKLFRCLGLRRGLAFTLSSHLWYSALYMDFLCMVIGIWNPCAYYALLLEFSVKTLLLTMLNGCKNFLFNVVYSFIWPFFRITTLILGVPYLLFHLERHSRR